MKKKQRVLIGYIGDGHAGGVDKYILDLVYTVDRERYEIDILTNSTNDELEKKLYESQIRILEIPSLKRPIRQYHIMKKLMEERQYDIAYFNISTAIHCIGILAAKRAGIINRIVHSHSSGVDCENMYKRSLFKIIHKVMKLVIAKTANTYIACSQKAGEWMFTKKVMKSDDFFIIYNAIQTEKYIFNSDLRYQMRTNMEWKNKKIILHVANFTYPKNHKFMLRVFEKVYQKDKNTRLILIGRGSKEKELREFVEKKGLKGGVIFTGNVSNVNEYLQGGDIFVLPSNFEGYPISALEAQISGIHCLLSDKITKESKIVEDCEFLPLNMKDWVERIIEIECSEERKHIENVENCEMQCLSVEVEKLWNRRFELK